MEPCTLGQSFPFVPLEVLCRIYDLGSIPTLIAIPGTPGVDPVALPPGKGAGRADASSIRNAEGRAVRTEIG